LQINTQINIFLKNAILYKNQTKEYKDQITFKLIRELCLNFTQILIRDNRTIYVGLIVRIKTLCIIIDA